MAGGRDPPFHRPGQALHRSEACLGRIVDSRRYQAETCILGNTLFFKEEAIGRWRLHFVVSEIIVCRLSEPWPQRKICTCGSGAAGKSRFLSATDRRACSVSIVPCISAYSDHGWTLDGQGNASPANATCSARDARQSCRVIQAPRIHGRFGNVKPDWAVNLGRQRYHGLHVHLI